jgi:hypothetical protein
MSDRAQKANVAGYGKNHRDMAEMVFGVFLIKLTKPVLGSLSAGFL